MPFCNERTELCTVFRVQFICWTVAIGLVILAVVGPVLLIDIPCWAIRLVFSNRADTMCITAFMGGLVIYNPWCIALVHVAVAHGIATALVYLTCSRVQYVTTVDMYFRGILAIITVAHFVVPYPLMAMRMLTDADPIGIVSGFVSSVERLPGSGLLASYFTRGIRDVPAFITLVNLAALVTMIAMEIRPKQPHLSTR